MSVLVNFEDKYGVCDIMFYHFFETFIDDFSKQYNSEDDTFEINRACGSRVLLPLTLDDKFNKVIFVYDMDKIENKGDYNILSSKVLESKINKLKRFYYKKELKFIPTVFAAETICLHMLKPYGQDFSKILSSSNTAYLHATILRDLIINKRESITNKRDTKDNNFIEIKITRKYLEELNDLCSTITKLRGLKFSKLNDTLFKWAEGNDITDTSKLLDGKEAIELQKEFEEQYIESIRSNKREIVINGKKYNLDTKYIV